MTGSGATMSVAEQDGAMELDGGAFPDQYTRRRDGGSGSPRERQDVSSGGYERLEAEPRAEDDAVPCRSPD